MILTGSGEPIDAANLLPAATRSTSEPAAQASGIDNLLEYAIHHGLSFSDLETRLLDLAVARAGGNLSAASRLLGMTRPRLYRRLQQLGLGAAVSAGRDGDAQVPIE